MSGDLFRAFLRALAVAALFYVLVAVGILAVTAPLLLLP